MQRLKCMRNSKGPVLGVLLSLLEIASLMHGPLACPKTLSTVMEVQGMSGWMSYSQTNTKTKVYSFHAFMCFVEGDLILYKRSLEEYSELTRSACISVSAPFLF